MRPNLVASPRGQVALSPPPWPSDSATLSTNSFTYRAPVTSSAPWFGIGNFCRPARGAYSSSATALATSAGCENTPEGHAPPMPVRIPSLSNLSLGRSFIFSSSQYVVHSPSGTLLPAGSPRHCQQAYHQLSSKAYPPTATAIRGKAAVPAVAGKAQRRHIGLRKRIFACGRSPCVPSAESSKAAAVYSPTAAAALASQDPTPTGSTSPAPDAFVTGLAREALSRTESGRWPSMHSFKRQRSGSSIASPPPADDADWWSHPDAQFRSKGFAGLNEATTLLAAQIQRHAPGEKHSLPRRSAKLYEEMGAREKGKQYVAVWLNMDAASLVFLSESIDDARLGSCLQGDFLKKRLKLITVPVDMKLPFPAKPPASADTVGSFFSGGASDYTKVETKEGAIVHCIRIDLFSVWFLRLAMRNVGFRPGNVIEQHLVDCQNEAVLSGICLMVTEDFCKALA